MNDDARTVYIRHEDETKCILLEVPESGIYRFQADESLALVKAVMVSLRSVGYKPTIIANDKGEFIDIELMPA